MLPTIPLFVSLVFGATTLLTLGLFMYAMQQARFSGRTFWGVTALLVGWLAIQIPISLSGFYAENTRDMPPRLMLMLMPPLLLMVALFALPAGRRFIDKLPLAPLTFLHIVRIPVEIVLYWLFLAKAVPELMTFAGRNFDILAGITAPIVTYLVFSRKLAGRRFLLVWNIISLGLVMFIVVNALLSAPLAFQQFAFDQPNIGVAYFPFVWLPAFVVPIVWFSHFVSIRKLVRNQSLS